MNLILQGSSAVARNGQTISKSASHVMQNTAATASATEGENSKSSKRVTDKSVSSKPSKSESIAASAPSVVKKLDGNISSGKSENTSKDLSLDNHVDGTIGLRRSSRIATIIGPIKGITYRDITSVPPRKRKDIEPQSSKLSSASQSNKAVNKGRSLSIEILSGSQSLTRAFFNK
jgi:hypothetical protein